MPHASGRHDAAIQELLDAGRILPDGRIARARTKGFHAPWIARNGYACVTVYIRGERFNMLRSNIVCTLAHGPRPSPRHQVDHINRVRDDDRPENLRWVTQSENNMNADNELRRIKAGKINRGIARNIRLMASETTMSKREIGQVFGISRRQVRDICRGVCWPE